MSAPATPYDAIGTPAIIALVNRFYDHMESAEPELARLHPPFDGTIPTGARERFALFLVGWLGGPQTYTEQHGHPRLRMRHAAVPIGAHMRDAWLRCMAAAMDVDPLYTGPVRAFLDGRFAEVADFLRNREG
jgi:hemoglobin